MTVAQPRMLFVNLPVRDLDKSVDFFTRLGFAFDPRFTDENATCMILSDQAYVMLLVEDFFKTFTTKDVCDATTHTEAILALSAGGRAQVDELVDEALAAGASPANEPVDQGFMYGRSFQDLDGHLWEVMWMDEAALEQEP
ncbi:MAG: VOC family protein [Acidimicrobiia bacterium]|nr:VOC family protein [Acidimicrobiia bacterium]